MTVAKFERARNFQPQFDTTQRFETYNRLKLVEKIEDFSF